jgi:type IV secretion system protein VirD4
MNWILVMLWALPGMVMAFGVYGLLEAYAVIAQALILCVASYMFGGLFASIGYESARWVEKIRSGKVGSARFASLSGDEGKKVKNEHGVIIGKKGRKILRYNKPGHLITISKTRGGKGVSSVVPNLLDHKGSCFCIDIKGENLAITGKQRTTFGKVYAIAPFDNYSSQFNPLDFVRPGIDEVDDASLVASLIVTPSSGDDGFWEREARALITGLILYAVRHNPREKQNLIEVRRLLTLPPEEFDELLDTMANSPHQWIKRAANAFVQKAEKERSGVISTAQSHTKVFDSPRLAKIIQHSEFQLEDMKRHVMTVYMCIPPHQIAVYRPFMRLIVGLATASMTRVPDQPDDPVLFLLDEFPSLGKMPIGGFAYLAGYGVRLWAFTQSLDQLEAVYGKGVGLITANCAVTQAWSLAPADFKTAETLSRTLGDTTINQFSTSRSAKTKLSIKGHNYSDSKSERTRRLLTPDEILCMPEETQLLFVTGTRPFLVERIVYYREKMFQGLFGSWGKDHGKT